MKPKKNEAKTDFLKRCTGQKIKEGMNQPDAFAACNLDWSTANGERQSLSLNAPVTFQKNEGQAAEESQKPTFLITGYTGKIVDRGWWKLVIAVNGIKSAQKMPVLREHMRDRVVGWSMKSWKEGNNFLLSGDFSEKTSDGKEVLDLAEEGFPWQASIGVWPLKVKVLESEKEEETVNGQMFNGPGEIWLESEVRETSFVALGADKDTAAISMSGDSGKAIPVEIFFNQKQEEHEMPITLERLTSEAPELLAQIISGAKKDGMAEGITQERARVTEILAVDADAETQTKAIKEGLSADGAFKLFFEAEKGKKKENLEDLKKQTPPPVKPSGSEKDSSKGAEFMAEVDKYQAEKKCSRAEALRATVKTFPALHEAYLAGLKK